MCSCSNSITRSSRTCSIKWGKTSEVHRFVSLIKLLAAQCSLSQPNMLPKPRRSQWLPHNIEMIQNFNKRLVKSPKLYFYDTGLACSLLGIRDASQVHTHFLRGALFENLVMNEFIKRALID